MEAEMLRREFREASLLANGGGGGGGQAVLEPSGQTQVDLTATADRRPVAAVAATVSRQLQQSTAAADHSSDGSSSVDSRRVVDMAYAYGNQSEYTAAGHCAKSGAAPQTVKPTSTVNNNDDEYLVEQRLLGHGTDVGGAEAVGSPPLPSPPPLPAPQPPSRSGDICSAEDRTVAT